MTNAALIAKLESAKEGSRELSDEVLMALGWQRRPIQITGVYEWYRTGGDHYIGVVRPDPSRNLQDAVDLIPGKAHWAASYPVGEAELVYGGPNGRLVTADAATAPLAMCIAILKAVEAGDG